MKIQPEDLFPHDPIPLIDMDTVSLNGKRYYKTPTGALYPSVTTVTSSVKKQYIEEWKARVGEEEARRISRKATTRGTAVHSICENYLANKPDYKRGVMPPTIELFNKIKPIVDEHVELVYGIELALFSHELKTAGRTDLFCRFMGVNTILDFKTANKTKNKADIEDYFIQATTYAMMVEEMYADYKKIYIPQIAIVIAVEEAGATGQLFVESTMPYRAVARKLFNDYHENNPLPIISSDSVLGTGPTI